MSTTSLFVARQLEEELGAPQILTPIIASLVFLAVIFWKRNYFKHAPQSKTPSIPEKYLMQGGG